jgi:predicted transcriptional regulator
VFNVIADSGFNGGATVVVSALCGAILSAIAAVFTYKVQMKKASIDYWTALQHAQLEFQASIRTELQNTKTERDDLQRQIFALKVQVDKLMSQNEALVLEKLEWMQKTVVMHGLIQKVVNEIPNDKAQGIIAWLEEVSNSLKSKTGAHIT